MNRELKNARELFDYLMYAYPYELEDVQTNGGIQKRIKDATLEYELKNKTKEIINVKKLSVELKLGPNYNRTDSPWLQIFTSENRSGTKGRYVGISFSKETDEIDLWIGFGRTSKKKEEVFELAKEYKMKYSLIEPNLKYGFEYSTKSYDALVLIKKINIKNFDEEEFKKDLEYITTLYKEYEVRFQDAPNSLLENKASEIQVVNRITYEEINQRMLDIIEQIGTLAEAIKNLK